MPRLKTDDLVMMLVWAFRDERVETATHPPLDALTVYCNVIALPVAEAATIIRYAREGTIPQSDPLALARWTRGINLLRQYLEQPMSNLDDDFTWPAQSLMRGGSAA